MTGNNKKGASSDADLLHSKNHAADNQNHLDMLRKSNEEIATPTMSDRRAVIDAMTHLPMIEIKEIACYLSLLEGGDVKDKLECKFCFSFLFFTSFFAFFLFL